MMNFSSIHFLVDFSIDYESLPSQNEENLFLIS